MREQTDVFLRSCEKGLKELHKELHCSPFATESYRERSAIPAQSVVCQLRTTHTYTVLWAANRVTKIPINSFSKHKRYIPLEYRSDSGIYTLFFFTTSFKSYFVFFILKILKATSVYIRLDEIVIIRIYEAKGGG